MTRGCWSLTEDGAYKRLIVHVSIGADLDPFEQLVHLLIGHLFPELRQHIPQFAGANESVALLVKHLKSTNELLGSARGLESVWPVQNCQKKFCSQPLGERLPQYQRLRPE